MTRTGESRMKRMYFEIATPQSMMHRGFILCGLLAGIVLWVLPNAKTPLLEIQPFLPLFKSATATFEILTGSLLYYQFLIERLPTRFVLGTVFLFRGLLYIPDLVLDPRILQNRMSFDNYSQISVWLWILNHIGFLLGMAVYLLIVKKPFEPYTVKTAKRYIVIAVSLVVGLVSAIVGVLILFPNRLPVFVQQNDFGSYQQSGVGQVLFVSLGLVMVWLLYTQRGNSLLDFWLSVILFASGMEVGIAGFSQHFYSYGWYLSELYGLLSAILIFGAILYEYYRVFIQLVQQESEFRAMYELSAIGIARIDITGRLLAVNRTLQDMLGYTEEELQGRSYLDLAHPDEDVEEIRRLLSETIENVKSHFQVERRYFRKDGQIVWFHITFFPVRDLRGNVLFGYCIIEDITERKRSEQRLEESEQRYKSLFEHHPDIVCSFDLNGRVINVNSAVESITGAPVREVIGRTFDDFIVSDDLDKVWEYFHRAVKGEILSHEVSIVTRLGKILNFTFTNVPIVVNQEIVGVYVIAKDITEKKRAEATILHMAYHDSLTDLPNRRLFKERLEKALKLAKRDQHQVAVMFLDLDRFKMINDTFGHALGDEILKQVSDRLTRLISESKRRAKYTGLVARMGGDEFICLIPNVKNQSEVEKIANDILQMVEKPYHCGHEQQVFHLSASIGIVMYPDDGEDVDTLLRRADSAMYNAKEKGKNNYQFYTSMLQDLGLQRLSIENDLRRALENEEFELYYQPQVSMRTGMIYGMEALLRWKHPELGEISPQQFIPVAEDSGLIVPIGEWVLRTACRQNKLWQESGLPMMRIAVNLSSRQFKQENLVETIHSILEETGLEPVYLELEITETIAMNQADYTIEKLEALKRLGIQIAIDDFGTGYSSLNYLKRYPIDSLKIDRSFVRDIPRTSDDMAIVSAIIAMAHSLNLKVIVEGVETMEQLRFLHKQGCDAMQGYFFSKPLPADEIQAFCEMYLRQHGMRFAGAAKEAGIWSFFQDKSTYALDGKTQT
jgi:diguanylate cyclase (GGDEF)-like protein/PAS domain S-box-containing protein